MSRSTLFFSLALVLAAGYAAYLRWEVSQLREQVAAAAHAVPPPALGAAQGPSTAGSRPNDRKAKAQTVDARGGRPSEGAEQQADAAEQRRTDWQERRRARQERFLAAFDDPELRLDMVERQMERIDSQFSDFFRGANLSPEQVEALRAALAEREITRWEERMRSFSMEDDEARATLQAEMEGRRLALTAEIAAMLGEDGMRQFEFYEESLPFRREVDQFASSLSYTDRPLSESQSETLIARLAEANSDFEYTMDLSDLRRGGWDEIDPRDVATYFAERAARDDMLIESARGVLDAEQLRAFAERRLADRERDRREIEFRLQNRGERD